MEITLLSVNAGQAEPIGMRRGKPVLSGYLKRPVSTGTVSVGPVGMDGDVVADLRVHGGPDKAIYAYSADHFPFWTEAMRPDRPFAPGSFAENLTLAGIDETGVSIGDIWQWGEAVLQIAQPRYPCFKMALANDRAKIVKRFLAEGRSGIYLRVLQPGEAPASGRVAVIKRDPAGITVREAAMAMYQETDPMRQREIASHPALAVRWKEMLLHSALTLEDGAGAA